MVGNFRVTVDGDTRDVDSVEEAARLSDGAGGEDDRVVIDVRHTGEEWIATVEDPDLEYEGRADRKWGAIRDLVETVDERARRFGF